jgi:hypothetical protein
MPTAVTRDQRGTSLPHNDCNKQWPQEHRHSTNVFVRIAWRRAKMQRMPAKERDQAAACEEGGPASINFKEYMRDLFENERKARCSSHARRLRRQLQLWRLVLRTVN